jgi:plasmid stability protein
MPSLSVRKLDEKTLQALRMQAAKNAHSMEEEVRQILKRSISTHERLGDLAVRLFSQAYATNPLEKDTFEVPNRERNEPVVF